MDVKSVYNFVPAPEEKDVFKPEWANQVSHDIPFSDGESGEIEFTLTAKSPIFIRNGHSKADKETFDKQKKGELPNPTNEDKEAINRYLEFSNVERNGKKEFFIPATSVKGMIRNVLEIMSFSRMDVANDIFSFRDLNNRKFKIEVAQNSQLKTGWLEKDDNNWLIKPCEIGRISIQDIERKFNVSFTDKTAKEKYELAKNLNQTYNFIKERDLGRPTANGFQKTGTLYKFSTAQNDLQGNLVFFGSIQGKKYEYIFCEPIDTKYSVSDTLIKRFEDIDAKHNETQWQFLTKDSPYTNNRIPVFFKLKSDGIVEHFGFSRLYKMSNTKYLNELSPLNSYYNRSEQYQPDLSETIFGSVEDNDSAHGNNRNNYSLKGRVYFSHALAEGEVKIEGERTIVMASPKASYFPFYLQDGKTYIDKATLNGFKKYPVHTGVEKSQLNEDNLEIETKIRPLSEKTVFICKVRFHNLRKVEIGALISAITFHHNSDKLFHTIGSAKPLGYGKIQIQVNDSNWNLKHGMIDYLKSFEDLMQNRYNNKWLVSNSLKELYAVSLDQLTKFTLEYPQLELPNVNQRDANEFNNYKKEGLWLRPYIDGRDLAFKSISAIVERNNMHQQGNFDFPMDTLQHLKDKIKESDLGEIKGILQEKLFSALINIYNVHPSSKHKLDRNFETEYEWEKTITGWLGKEKAFEFYKRLTGKDS
jgi:CRISPR-associated protein (TIGR03986 family)